MINYGIFFTKGSTVIRLPLNPEELPDIQASNNETYNILGLGDVTSIRRPAQRTISISGLFPARPESYVLTPNQFWTPEQYINFFRDAMMNGDTLVYTPVRYMEDGSPFATSDVGFTCTIEGFEVTEKGGETGDFWYKLSIKEYRNYSPQTVKIDFKKSVKTVTQSKTREVPKDVFVVGDKVQVNGTVTQNPSGTGTKKDVSGATGTVVRKDTSKPQQIAVRDDVTGAVAFAKETALKLVTNVSNTLLRSAGIKGGISGLIGTSYSDRA